MIDIQKMVKAWQYLANAINFEQQGADYMGKARMSLILACAMELQALGFQTIQFNGTEIATSGSKLAAAKYIEPWNCPYAVIAAKAVEAVRARVEERALHAPSAA